jgi:two-component system OmpR family response regulator
MNIHHQAPPASSALASPPNVPPAKVGILEDEPAMRTLLNRLLANEFSLWFAGSGEQLAQAVQKKSVDLVLLDILLPGEDGISIAKTIRARSDVPLILLSGLSSADTITSGLNIGADDYVTKPFQANILRARMRNALRRARASQDEANDAPQFVQVVNCKVDLWSREVTNDSGESVRLTEKELHILTALARTPGKVNDRDKLSRLVSGQEWSPTNRCLDVHISHLRKKLTTVTGNEKIIASFRGAGYALKVSETSASDA